MNLNQSTLLSA